MFAARLDELVETLCLENGKFKGEASYEIAHIVRSLRFTAGLATQVFARVLDPVPGKQSMSTRQPMGVARLMIPWKLPGLPADPGARPVHGVGVRVRRQAVRPGGADRRGAGGLLHGGA